MWYSFIPKYMLKGLGFRIMQGVLLRGKDCSSTLVLTALTSMASKCNVRALKLQLGPMNMSSIIHIMASMRIKKKWN
jgi:hypothetical protein